MNSEILVYGGPGAEPSGLLKSLLAEVSAQHHSIRVVGAWHVANDAHMFSTAAVLIMPGGADVPYCQALNGQGNANIRNFVEKGGNYLGICAGAYYGASRIEFHAGRPDAICGNRELAFFPGCATGSIPEFGAYYEMTKRSAAAVAIAPASGECFGVYYHGGCFFQPEAQTGFDVLARYTDLAEMPAAVVRMAVGEGQVILSGIHPEMSPDMLAADLGTLTDRREYRHLVTSLQQTDSARQTFWRGLLQNCGLTLS